jgi:hypothetical protein
LLFSAKRFVAKLTLPFIASAIEERFVADKHQASQANLRWTKGSLIEDSVGEPSPQSWRSTLSHAAPTRPRSLHLFVVYLLKCDRKNRGVSEHYGFPHWMFVLNQGNRRLVWRNWRKSRVWSHHRPMVYTTLFYVV